MLTVRVLHGEHKKYTCIRHLRSCKMLKNRTASQLCILVNKNIELMENVESMEVKQVVYFYTGNL